MLICNASEISDTNTVMCSILSQFTSDHVQTVSPAYNCIFDLFKILADKGQTLEEAEEDAKS